MTSENGGRLLPSGSHEPVTIRYWPRTVDVHQVTMAELRQLGSVGFSVHLAFLGIAVGLAVAFGIALLTATLDKHANAAFVALFGTSLFGTVYFAVRARIDWRAREAIIRSVTGEDRRTA